MTSIPYDEPNQIGTARAYAPEAEAAFATKVVKLLDDGLDALSPETLAKLHHARQSALLRHAHTSPGSRRTGLFLRHPLLGSIAQAAAIASLVLIAGLGNYEMRNEQMAEIVDVEATLLVDDLPIDAYLDPGFDKWLTHDERS